MKKEYKYLGLIILISLFVRLYYFFNVIELGNDAIMYLRLAQSLKEGVYSFGLNYNWGIIYPPGYPLLINWFSYVFNDYVLSARLISLLFSLGTIIFFYAIGKELYNEYVGLWGATVFAFFPYMIRSFSLINSEALFYFLFISSIYWFIKIYKTQRWIYYFLFSISWGWATLTRSEGILLILLFCFVPVKQLFNKKNIFKFVNIFILFLICVVPYGLYLYKETGKFSISGKTGFNLYIGEASLTKDYERLTYELADNKAEIQSFKVNNEWSTWKIINKDLNKFIYRYFINLLKQIYYLIILLPAIIIPLWYTFFNKKYWKQNINKYYLLFLVILYILVLSLFLVSLRYMYTVVLLLLIISMYGFSKLSKKQMTAAFMFLLIVFIVFGVQEQSRTEIISNEYKEIGNYIYSINPQPWVIVMSRKPYVSYYSGSDYATLPYANATDVLEFARRNYVSYIIIDERMLKDWKYYDELLNLNEYKIKFIKAELVYEIEKPKVKVFELVLT